MDIHEHQGKELFSGKIAGYDFDIPVAEGHAAHNLEAAKTIINDMFTRHQMIVVKAQIHAGGRGKAGGVKLAKSVEEAWQIAQEMFGMTLVTPQTGSEGKVVQRLFFEAGANIAQEFYLSLVVDRSKQAVTFIASPEGGTEIEEVAEARPEAISRVSVDISLGFKAYHGLNLAKVFTFNKQQCKNFCKIARDLYNLFIATDANQIEVNPLIMTPEGNFIALDAKINFDDNALGRHPNLEALRDPTEEDELENRAKAADLSYIKMEGNIGCMVNGAGLAMATMDLIKLHGGNPANFLDVGGGASKEKVAEAFKIILSDPKIEAILVNIFGGIMRCDIIAQGIIEAVKEVGLNVPLVVRLSGTNVEIGQKLINESGLEIIAAANLAEAAKSVMSQVA